jgi:hypothetical protein
MLMDSSRRSYQMEMKIKIIHTIYSCSGRGCNQIKTTPYCYRREEAIQSKKMQISNKVPLSHSLFSLSIFVFSFFCWLPIEAKIYNESGIKVKRRIIIIIIGITLVIQKIIMEAIARARVSIDV